MSKDSYLTAENDMRTDSFKKDRADEIFLERLNTLLERDEPAMRRPVRQRYPHLFIMGLPRSGTTLMMQLVCAAFNIGYINNLIARFWQAPLQGIRLSRILLSKTVNVSFQSQHGVTPNLSDPHEFGYFWSDWLGKGETIRAADEVNWNGLKDALDQVAEAFGKPVVHKNLLVGMHIAGIARTIENAVFIWIRRHPADTAMSILKARESRYGSRQKWWSLRPPQWQSLAELPWDEQIAGQIGLLTNHFRNQFKQAGIRPLEISYASLCQAPGAVLQQIQARLSRLDWPLDTTGSWPDRFSCRTYEKYSQYHELEQALKRYDDE